MIRCQRGQTLVVSLGAAVFLMAGVSALGALGKALLGKGRSQRAADLAAVSAARSMRDDFARLFEPAVDSRARPNGRHLDKDEYLERARATAVEIARLNGADPRAVAVRFPDERSFAPIRVRVRVAGAVSVRPPDGPAASVGVRSVAEAELTPPAGSAGEAQPELAAGPGYSGPLAYRQGKPVRSLFSAW